MKKHQIITLLIFTFSAMTVERFPVLTYLAFAGLVGYLLALLEEGEKP